MYKEDGEFSRTQKHTASYDAETPKLSMLSEYVLDKRLVWSSVNC